MMMTSDDDALDHQVHLLMDTLHSLDDARSHHIKMAHRDVQAIHRSMAHLTSLLNHILSSNSTKSDVDDVSRASPLLENLSSIAHRVGCTMDALRSVNPQLHHVGDTDVLPINTFIRIPMHANQQQQQQHLRDAPAPLPTPPHVPSIDAIHNVEPTRALHDSARTDDEPHLGYTQDRRDTHVQPQQQRIVQQKQHQRRDDDVDDDDARRTPEEHGHTSALFFTDDSPLPMAPDHSILNQSSLQMMMEVEGDRHAAMPPPSAPIRYRLPQRMNDRADARGGNNQQHHLNGRDRGAHTRRPPRREELDEAPDNTPRQLFIATPPRDAPHKDAENEGEKSPSMAISSPTEPSASLRRSTINNNNNAAMMLLHEASPTTDIITPPRPTSRQSGAFDLCGITISPLTQATTPHHAVSCGTVSPSTADLLSFSASSPCATSATSPSSSSAAVLRRRRGSMDQRMAEEEPTTSSSAYTAMPPPLPPMPTTSSYAANNNNNNYNGMYVSYSPTNTSPMHSSKAHRSTASPSTDSRASIVLGSQPSSSSTRRQRPTHEGIDERDVGRFRSEASPSPAAPTIVEQPSSRMMMMMMEEKEAPQDDARSPSAAASARHVMRALDINSTSPTGKPTTSSLGVSGPPPRYPTAAEPATQQPTSTQDDDIDGGGDDDDDEVYDTIAGIAEAYGFSVDEIVRLNTFLREFTIDEPLPPDMQIVLPMTQQV